MSVQLVDSHCHINFDSLHERLPEILSNASEADIKWMLCVAVCWEDMPTIITIAQQHPNIFASAGVHPNHDEGYEPTLDELIEMGSKDEVVAIGETGLDYFRSSGDLNWQHERFIRHIEAAKQLDKPLIIHTRNAADDTIKLLLENNAQQCTGVMHCFAEDWQFAKKALDIGFYISFSGIVTFKSAPLIQEVAKKMPLDRILVETDSPYLAPVPHRGKTNEPAFTRHTADFVAKLRNVPLEEIAEATTNNFFKLFKQAQRVN